MTMVGDFVLTLLEAALVEVLSRVPLDDAGEARLCRAPDEAASCNHGVTFDRAEAEGLTVEEIRRRWPRGWFPWPRGWFPPEKPCQDCGYVGIAYASCAHFVYGDW